jgi:ferritin
MISTRIQDAFNKQLNAEIYSSYLYLSMSAYLESVNLLGCANWMRCQAQEELVHAMKFYTYIIGRGGTVLLTTVDGPPTGWSSPLSVFEDTYKHEQKVTALINSLVDLTIEEKDHASNAFLQWFVTEQVEEEASANDVMQKLKLAGDQGGGLFLIDRELGQRIFTMPAAQAQV